MYRRYFSLQTSQVWSLPCPFSGKWVPTFSSRNGVSFHFLPTLVRCARQESIICRIRSSRKCQEVSLSPTSRVVVDKMPLNDICIISRKLQPFDNAPHVPSHLLSTFTNSCHLVICINCPHVCIVAFNNLVGWDFCQNILPSASCPLLPQNCRCFVRTVNSVQKESGQFCCLSKSLQQLHQKLEVGKLPWQGQML